MYYYPIELIGIANKIVADLAKGMSVPWPFTCDPFIKPRNMRVLLACMYCDDPDNLQRASLMVPIPIGPEVDIKSFELEVREVFAQALNDLLTYVGGGTIEPSCTIHRLAQCANDNTIVCGRCGESWRPVGTTTRYTGESQGMWPSPPKVA